MQSNRDTTNLFWTKNEQNCKIYHFGLKKIRFTILDKISTKKYIILDEIGGFGWTKKNLHKIFLVSLNMLVAQHKTSADIKGTLTYQ